MDFSPGKDIHFSIVIGGSQHGKDSFIQTIDPQGTQIRDRYNSCTTNFIAMDYKNTALINTHPRYVILNTVDLGDTNGSMTDEEISASLIKWFLEEGTKLKAGIDVVYFVQALTMPFIVEKCIKLIRVALGEEILKSSVILATKGNKFNLADEEGKESYDCALTQLKRIAKQNKIQGGVVDFVGNYQFPTRSEGVKKRIQEDSFLKSQFQKINKTITKLKPFDLSGVKQKCEILINQIRNNSWVPPKELKVPMLDTLLLGKTASKVIPGYFAKSDQRIKDEAIRRIVQEELQKVRSDRYTKLNDTSQEKSQKHVSIIIGPTQHGKDTFIFNLDQRLKYQVKIGDGIKSCTQKLRSFKYSNPWLIPSEKGLIINSFGFGDKIQKMTNEAILMHFDKWLRENNISHINTFFFVQALDSPLLIDKCIELMIKLLSKDIMNSSIVIATRGNNFNPVDEVSLTNYGNSLDQLDELCTQFNVSGGVMEFRGQYQYRKNSKIISKFASSEQDISNNLQRIGQAIEQFPPFTLPSNIYLNQRMDNFSQLQTQYQGQNVNQFQQQQNVLLFSENSKLKTKLNSLGLNARQVNGQTLLQNVIHRPILHYHLLILDAQLIQIDNRSNIIKQNGILEHGIIYFDIESNIYPEKFVEGSDVMIMIGLEDITPINFKLNQKKQISIDQLMEIMADLKATHSPLLM